MKSQDAVSSIESELDVKFQSWRSVREATKDIDRLDKEFKNIEWEPGIYLIKQEQSVNRLQGDSDILYIGQGQLGDRLYGVLAKFFSARYNTKGWHHDVKEPVYELVENKGREVYFTYCQCSEKEAKEKEKNILKLYKEQHLELPPWNYRV